jgi:hypothetical protein
MSPSISAVVIGLAVIVLIVVVVSRSRRSNDGVDSFRRQIDALSPEARRPVIDQMYGATDRNDQRVDPRIDVKPIDADAGAEAAADPDPDPDPDPGTAGEDGAHGA